MKMAAYIQIIPDRWDESDMMAAAQLSLLNQNSFRENERPRVLYTT